MERNDGSENVRATWAHGLGLSELHGDSIAIKVSKRLGFESTQMQEESQFKQATRFRIVRAVEPKKCDVFWIFGLP